MKHLGTLAYVDAVARAGSIRKAADALAITSTALNRRILALEEELGVPLFERLARGVRLSAAGELMVQHIRLQLSDLERVKAQIADLAGERRGHVAIACSQALLPYFLPEQISAYRRDHAKVTFGVAVRDRAAAERALMEHSADLAIVFEPVQLSDFQILQRVRQPVHVVMPASHPLATQASVRLRDCLSYPLALPVTGYGVRHLLEQAARRALLTLSPAVEADNFEFLRHHAAAEGILSFQISVGLPAEPAKLDDTAEPAGGPEPPMVSRPIDHRDVPPGVMYLGQLRGRTLPVAAARFAQQLQATFAARYVCE